MQSCTIPEYHNIAHSCEFILSISIYMLCSVLMLACCPSLSCTIDLWPLEGVWEGVWPVGGQQAEGCSTYTQVACEGYRSGYHQVSLAHVPYLFDELFSCFPAAFSLPYCLPSPSSRSSFSFPPFPFSQPFLHAYNYPQNSSAEIMSAIMSIVVSSFPRNYHHRLKELEVKLANINANNVR